MIMSGQYLNYIIREISVLRYEISSKNLLSLTDDSIHMQNFMRDLLNIAFGYELVNLNDERKNFPGLDLGDEGRSIGFQITATKSGQKVRETINTCVNNECCHKYKNLKFFIVTEKQGSYTIDNNNDIFTFFPDNDILDFDDYYRYVLSLSDLSKRKKICEYISSEVPQVLHSLGIDYFDQSDFRRYEKPVTCSDWKTETRNGAQYYILRVNHNFGYTPSSVTLLAGGKSVLITPTITETYIEIAVMSKSCLNATIIITS